MHKMAQKYDGAKYWEDFSGPIGPGATKISIWF